jgi:hypothetical protein
VLVEEDLVVPQVVLYLLVQVQPVVEEGVQLFIMYQFLLFREHHIPLL